MFVDTSSASFKELVNSDPIKAAITLCTPATQKGNRIAPPEKERLISELNGINQLIENLLPIEKESLPVIQTKKQSIENRLAHIKIAEKFEFKNFCLESLRWRNRHGYPRLAVFDINSPKFEIICSSEGTKYREKEMQGDITPIFDTTIRVCYEDVVEALLDRAVKAISNIDVREKVTFKLSATFSMLIPRHVRIKISQCRNLFKSIYIVVDVKDWELAENRTTGWDDSWRRSGSSAVNKDPLVIGYDGISYWLIAVFDLTPLEAYIAGECRKSLK